MEYISLDIPCFYEGQMVCDCIRPSKTTGALRNFVIQIRVGTPIRESGRSSILYRTEKFSTGLLANQHREMRIRMIMIPSPPIRI